ncbi:hypothetical protein [Moraxella oblonga]|uniref:hypothetical protein n=1 Tax=Moraxella oblonga TaxID=200413 RepID=UPI0008330F27|nr:hypothetical protein [Moraxella oblonga]
MTFLQKIKRLNTTVFFVLFLVLATLAFVILNDRGWHIPTDSEIHHATGIIHVIGDDYHQKNGSGSVAHIQIHTDDGKKIYLTCSYTALGYTQYSGCEQGWAVKDFKNVVHKQQGEVSWYVQNKFLGITNPYPQLLSMTVRKDGKVIYERTKEQTLTQMSKGGHTFSVLFFLFHMLILYWVFKPIDLDKMQKKYEKKKAKKQARYSP